MPRIFLVAAAFLSFSFSGIAAAQEGETKTPPPEEVLLLEIERTLVAIGKDLPQKTYPAAYKLASRIYSMLFNRGERVFSDIQRGGSNEPWQLLLKKVRSIITRLRKVDVAEHKSLKKRLEELLALVKPAAPAAQEE